MKLLFSVALLVCIALAVEGRSGGAPAAACDTLAPDVSLHGAQPQTSASNPYSIDISAFDDGNGGFEYTLGETYTCKLYFVVLSQLICTIVVYVHVLLYRAYRSSNHA